MVSVRKSLNLFLTISFFHATRSGPQFNVLLEHNSGPPHHLPHPVQQHVGGQLTAPSTDPRLIQDAFMQPPHHLPPQHHNTVREIWTSFILLIETKRCFNLNNSYQITAAALRPTKHTSSREWNEDGGVTNLHSGTLLFPHMFYHSNPSNLDF